MTHTADDVAAAKLVLQLIAGWRHRASNPEEFYRRDRELLHLEDLLAEVLGPLLAPPRE